MEPDGVIEVNSADYTTTSSSIASYCYVRCCYVKRVPHPLVLVLIILVFNGVFSEQLE